MIGFACKINSSRGIADKDLNFKSTTLSWLRNNPQAANAKLESLLEYNLACFDRQLKFVSRLPKTMRMFRISSDMLPAYSSEFMEFYFSKTVSSVLESRLSKLGDFARANGIRLSFHPGQFCVLASDNPAIVENSLIEFEYHADIIRYLGYGKTFQDFKCNVHIGGKLGPSGIRKAYRALSREAQNSITIENQEFTWGLDHCLELADIIPIVFDIHHDWIYQDQYRQPTDAKIAQVIDSWRGIRPTMHFSLSKVLESSLTDSLALASSYGFTKQALRAHSDFIFSTTVSELVYEYHKYFDVMVEAKEKNLAQRQLVSMWDNNFDFDPVS